MTGQERERLISAVQANCHVADARHASDLTLCTYLLQMREFFRWERGLALQEPLAREQVGAWIAEREGLWETLEEQDFQHLPLPTQGSLAESEADPFDVESVSRDLRPLGLIYGAGLAGPERPLFFLADLIQETTRDGVTVRTAGREYARCLAAPPAALVNDGAQPSILIRRESLQRWCWERFETFSLRRTPGTAMAAVFDAYALAGDFDAALPRWLDDMSETLVLHELGEFRAGQILGPAWGEMRMSLPSRRADLLARAVRDHLADLGLTLPTLLARGDPAPIHAWFATYEGLRETLFPSLKNAYQDWRDGDKGAALQDAATRGYAHFEALAQQALALHVGEGKRAGAKIEALLESPTANFAL